MIGQLPKIWGLKFKQRLSVTSVFVAIFTRIEFLISSKYYFNLMIMNSFWGYLKFFDLPSLKQHIYPISVNPQILNPQIQRLGMKL